MKQKLIRWGSSFICVAVLLVGTVLRPMAADRISWNEITNINKDVNGSGKITDEDLVVLKRALVEEKATIAAHDVTGNGTVDVQDVVRLKKVIVTLDSSELNGSDNGDNGETSIKDLFPDGDF